MDPVKNVIWVRRTADHLRERLERVSVVGNSVKSQHAITQAGGVVNAAFSEPTIPEHTAYETPNVSQHLKTEEKKTHKNNPQHSHRPGYVSVKDVETYEQPLEKTQPTLSNDAVYNDACLGKRKQNLNSHWSFSM